MNYRAEIDGLRAIAVVSVIFFHGDIELFQGGFVGVDVFFVISGYLITTGLVSEIEGNRFNLLDFYGRRARRIFPALFFVMLASIPFAWFWMLPDPLENFGQSLVATALFSNNILLWITTGYWDLEAGYKPFLHTWSLGVEEQYYIFFPILLLVAWRNGKGAVFLLVVLLALISLALSDWYSRANPSANFYLLPTRAWEILVGSIAAFVAQNRALRSEILSSIGLAGVIFSIFYFDAQDAFPGLIALVPVLGTAFLILFARDGTLAARILGSRALVGMGLISYSAYLWHQPILTFAKIYSFASPGRALIFVLISVTFLLAFLTWRFIERPFRNRALIPRSTAFLSSLGAVVFFVVLGSYFHLSNGVPTRMYSFEEFQRSSHEIKTVNLEKGVRLSDLEFNRSGSSVLAVIGDSYAADVVYLLKSGAPSLKYVFLAPSGEYDSKDNAPQRELCAPDFVSLLKLKNVRSLIVAYDEGYDITCSRELTRESDENGIKLLFVGTKQFGVNLNWIGRLDRKGRSNLCQPPAPEYMAIDARDRGIIPEQNYIAFFDLAGNESCFPVTNSAGELLASDGKHFTVAGVEFFAPKFLNSPHVVGLLSEE